MPRRPARENLEAMQQQITALKAAIGLLVGTMRATGALDAAAERAFYERIEGARRYTPTVGAREWDDTLDLVRSFAALVSSPPRAD
jgi:hypothetical protein